jgi:hypothetical protein
MLERVTIFVEDPPTIFISRGRVYIEDRDDGGGLLLRRVMPLSTFMRLLAHGQRLVAEWSISQSGKVEAIRGDEVEDDQAASRS